MTKHDLYWLIQTIVCAWSMAYVAWRHDPALGVFGIMAALLATGLGAFAVLAWYVTREREWKRG